ncbi:MAG TPA: hypothetical protein VE988_30450 [Gemmataceae bacterium]|nr:hypothetical protein [Gemmataceae bacterium]
MPAQEKDVYVLGTRRCSFPFDIGEGSREKIGWINVYCSTDQGKSWKKMGQAKADAGSLPVEFETNGLYWIAMQIFSVNGTTDPLSTEDLKPVMKVRVDENPNRK